MATLAGLAGVAMKLSADGAGLARHGFRAAISADTAFNIISDDDTYIPGTNLPFEMIAGSSINLFWQFDSGNESPAATTPNVGDIICSIQIRQTDDTLIRDFGTVFSVPTLWARGFRSGSLASFFATTNGNSGGTPLAGTFKIYVKMQYAQTTNDAVNGKYIADSEGLVTLAGTPNLWAATVAAADKGYIRAGLVPVNILVGRTLGGTPPAPFAWPDRLRVRFTPQSAAGVNATAIPANKSLGITYEAITAAGATSTVADTSTQDKSATSTWDDDGTGARLDTTLGVAATTIGAQLRISANDPLSGRPWTHFDLQGGQSPIEFVAGALDAGSTSTRPIAVKTVGTQYNMDLRLSFSVLALTVDAASQALGFVVNYGLNAMAGTFKLLNARNVQLDSSLPAADVAIILKYRDSSLSKNERNIPFPGPTTLSPNASGVYTIPSQSIPGPDVNFPGTARSNRGQTGQAADSGKCQADHTQAGRPKVLNADVNSANSPAGTLSATYINLSDLLRLDAHPQKTSTLSRDTDPYAVPGSAEDTQYVISADILNLFAFVGDVHANALGPVAVTATIISSAGVSQASSSAGSTQASGVNKGWVVGSLQFAVSAPSGNWVCRVAVDVDAVGTAGNFGDDNSGAIPFGTKEQIVGVSSAYTADRSVAFHVPDQVATGVAQEIRAQYINYDGTQLTPDAMPTLRVFSISSAGVEVDDLAAAAMTQLDTLTPPGKAWGRTWTPTANGVYIVEIAFQMAGGKVTACATVSVRPRYALKIGALTDRF